MIVRIRRDGRSRGDGDLDGVRRKGWDWECVKFHWSSIWN